MQDTQYINKHKRRKLWSKAIQVMCNHTLLPLTLNVCVWGSWGLGLAQAEVKLCHYCLQTNPDGEYAGWKNLSSTPELNFLSQIVILLFEDETQLLDSDSRYHIHLHIGSGVKARKQMLSEVVPFIDGEIHSPSFVKRLPTLPHVHRPEIASNSTPAVAVTPPPSSRVVRKIASYPSMHYLATQPIAVVATPPHHRRTSHSFTIAGGMSRDDSVLLKSSPESPGRKLSVGYTNESLQTLGEPGQFCMMMPLVLIL